MNTWIITLKVGYAFKMHVEGNGKTLVKIPKCEVFLEK